jgi:hypothetical protein
MDRQALGRIKLAYDLLVNDIQENAVATMEEVMQIM